MERAYIYARYSSDKQTEQSIEGQVRIITEFAKNNNIKIVDTFIDRAFSAKTDNRPAFQQMIKTCNKKLVDYVIVYKLDRFARNRYDSATYKSRLKNNGIKVLSATENLTDSPESVILESMLEGMAEYFSLELAQKVTRGMIETANKGKFTGGTVPFGFKIIDGYYKINPEQSEIVREIFKKYASGISIKEIVEELKNKGIKNNKNTNFSRTNIPRLLRNEKYIGILTYRGLRLPGKIPQIVDTKLFELVNKKLKSNKHKPASKKAKEPYLLTGKLYCGNCKENMVSESTSRNNTIYRYYKCYNKKCNCKPIQKEWLENYVLERSLEILNNKKLLSIIADNIAKYNEQFIKDNSILNNLKRNLKNVQKQIKNIIKAIEEGVFTSSTKERLEELEFQQEELELQIKSEEVNKYIPLTKENIQKFILKFISSKQENFKEIILDGLVRKVLYFNKEHIIIYFNFKVDDNKNYYEYKCSNIKSLGLPNEHNSNLVLTIYHDCFSIEFKKNHHV